MNLPSVCCAQHSHVYSLTDAEVKSECRDIKRTKNPLCNSCEYLCYVHPFFFSISDIIALQSTNQWFVSFTLMLVLCENGLATLLSSEGAQAQTAKDPPSHKMNFCLCQLITKVSQTNKTGYPYVVMTTVSNCFKTTTSLTYSI